MDMLRPSFRNRETIRAGRIAVAVVDGDLNVCLLARHVKKGHGFVTNKWDPSLDDSPMFAAVRESISRLVGRSSIQSARRRFMIHSAWFRIHYI